MERNPRFTPHPDIGHPERNHGIMPDDSPIHPEVKHHEEHILRINKELYEVAKRRKYLGPQYYSETPEDAKLGSKLVRDRKKHFEAIHAIAKKEPGVFNTSAGRRGAAERIDALHKGMHKPGQISANRKKDADSSRKERWHPPSLSWTESIHIEHKQNRQLFESTFPCPSL